MHTKILIRPLMQANLNLRWVRMSEGTFSDIAAHFKDRRFNGPETSTLDKFAAIL